MSAPPEDSDMPLPAIPLPDGTDHPVLAAILADLRARAHSAAGQAGPDDPGPSAVAHYEDAP